MSPKGVANVGLPTVRKTNTISCNYTAFCRIWTYSSAYNELSKALFGGDREPGQTREGWKKEKKEGKEERGVANRQTHIIQRRGRSESEPSSLPHWKPFIVVMTRPNASVRYKSSRRHTRVKHSGRIAQDAGRNGLGRKLAGVMALHGRFIRPIFGQLPALVYAPHCPSSVHLSSSAFSRHRWLATRAGERGRIPRGRKGPHF